MRIVRTLYMVARLARDAEVLMSLKPVKIAKRIVNKKLAKIFGRGYIR